MTRTTNIRFLLNHLVFFCFTSLLSFFWFFFRSLYRYFAVGVMCFSLHRFPGISCRRSKCSCSLHKGFHINGKRVCVFFSPQTDCYCIKSSKYFRAKKKRTCNRNACTHIHATEHRVLGIRLKMKSSNKLSSRRKYARKENEKKSSTRKWQSNIKDQATLKTIRKENERERESGERGREKKRYDRKKQNQGKEQKHYRKKVVSGERKKGKK